MATLHVRNVPDDLYERIRRRAAEENRSLGAEVVSLLERVLPEQAYCPAALDRIIRRRRQLERTVGRFPCGVDLLREDRAR